MQIQQANKAFCSLLSASGLLSEQKIRSLLHDFPQHAESSTIFASFLVEEGLLTKWQAGKLLQGKNRGFFLGPYKLLRHLAKGGMSTLYVAEHTETGEIHALKVLPPSKAEASDASYLPRFLREARLASQLHHPNVICVHEIFSAQDEQTTVHFMSMEFIEGADLFNKVALGGPLPIRLAAEVIRQAATGLGYAHGQGLIHRDVKPGNLFEAVDGTVKLLDLGLAGLAEDGGPENLTRDYNERVLGTADYLAPEQAVDSHRADSRADIYALGCTFYYLLTGRPPFIDGTLPQRILAHQTKSPQDVRTIRRDVPQPLFDVLQKMLVKQRAKRIQHAADVVDLIEAWLRSTDGDPCFDQPAAMIVQDSKLRGRRLQRIQPADRAVSRESPTDSIEAVETQTAASVSAYASSAIQRTNPETSYSKEFEQFLENLDEAHGVHDVMNRDFLKQRRRTYSVVTHVEAWAASGPEKDLSRQSACQAATSSSVQRRRLLDLGQSFLRFALCAGLVGVVAFGLNKWGSRILQMVLEAW